MLSKNFTIQYLDKMLTALTSKDQSMHVNELRQLIVIPSVVISAKNAGQSVFMTGATGFLGKRLLNDLLARTDDHYTCLVRASSREEGQKRLNIADQYRNRVDVICGDFTKPRFGLIDEDWQKLVQETRSIIHCGAVVNMVTSFEELRAANFDACLEVMRLALEGGVKHIDYISTLSVFVSTDQNTGTVFEHDMLETIGHVYGGYAQSKVAAELAFHNPDFTEYCSVTSYRLGLITGDTNNGMAAAHDFLSTFVRGISQLGCVPECDASRFTVDVTPVDYASDCLAKLITLDNKQDCYHIANSKGFSLAQMIAALKRKGIDLSVIPAKEWAFISQDRKLSSQEQATWLGLCRALPDDEYQRYRSMDLFQGTDIIFDQTRLRTSLPDVSCPPASDDLLDLYIDNMI